MCKVAECVIAGFLAAAACQDWRTKKVSCLLLSVMTVVTLGMQFLIIKENLLSILGGAAVGALFFLLSKSTREAVGYGDSWVILLLGIFLGGKDVLQVVLWAALFSSVFSIIYCIRHGFRGKQTVPFIPCLAAAYIGVVFL